MLQRRGGRGRDPPAGVSRSGERDRVDAGMRDQRGPGGAVALQDVDHPGGEALPLASLPMKVAVIGVCSAGLRMTVHPAASAALTPAQTAVGPFHGMIAATTPSGTFCWRTVNPLPTGGIEPSILVGQPGVVLDRLDGEADDVGAPLAQHAGVERVQVGQVSRACLDQLGEASQHALAPQRRESLQRPSSNARRAAATAASTSAWPARPSASRPARSTGRQPRSSRRCATRRSRRR